MSQVHEMARIMLVDDQPALRRLYGRALKAYGHEVVAEAPDGQTAVEAIEAACPDVVLLDLSMPRRDGLESIGELRRRRPEVRVVVLSGFGRAHLGPVTEELGAAGFIEKGATPSEVAAGIADALERPLLPYRPLPRERHDAMVERARQLL